MTHRKLCWIAGAIWLFVAAGCGDDGEGGRCDDPAAADTLRALADCAGFFVGAAFVQFNDEPEFRSTLAREFNSTTAPLYWEQVEPRRGEYDFRITDESVELALANRMRVRGHPLVWGRLGLPDYVRNETDAETLRRMVRERIALVVGRYRGRITQWDVVNEPLYALGIGPRPDGLEEYVFLRLLGPGYIREALELAHAADPDAKLFVNEFFVSEPGVKQDLFFELIRNLVESGAPLHGVGFQGHIRPPYRPGFVPTREQHEAAFRRFTALGLEVEITELDITLADPAAELDVQRRQYKDVFDACLAVPGCTGVTTWGVTDKFTWIRDFFRAEGAPLLFGELYERKPAYFGVRDALLERLRGATPP